MSVRRAASRVVGTLVSLGMVAVLGFFLFRVLPGDPVLTLTRGRPVTPGEVARLRHEFGLDRPLVTQFVDYAASLLRGDLGRSYFYDQPVARLIAERVGPTLLLTGAALVLSVSLGVWLGQRAGWRRGSAFDRAATAAAVVGWSVPAFWLGLLLLMAFGGPLPTGGMVTPGSDASGAALAWDVARHLVLPALTLAAVQFAQYTLTMRASVLGELGEGYLTTARAKGLPEDGVRARHVLPNALLPTVTLVFLMLGQVIGGAIAVESVFSWPGLGYLAYQALSAPDLPLLQGTFLVFSATAVVSNVLADVVYRLIDPRLRGT